MYITLTHDQLQRLRAYIDVAEAHRQTFNQAGFVAHTHCTIDDANAMLHITVDASPKTVVGVMMAKDMRYMTRDYHADPKHPTATYCVEAFEHQVMVIAVESKRYQLDEVAA